MKKHRQKTPGSEAVHTAAPARAPRRRLLSALVAQALCAPLVAQAASIAVNAPHDTSAADGDCTLREAVVSVNTGADTGGCTNTSADPFGTEDTITFDPSVAGGTITLGGMHIEIEKSVAINPGGSPTTIDAGGGSRIFLVNMPDLDVHLDWLVLTGGSVSGSSDGGAVQISAASTLTLSNSIVSGNAVTGDMGDGGGIHAVGNASVILVDSTVSDNTAVGKYSDGGGIYADDSGIMLTSSTVSGNTAAGEYSEGGGIYAASFTGMTLINSTVSGNTAVDDGGGIFAAFNTTASLRNSTVSGNTAGGRGGGVYVAFGSGMALTNAIVAGSQGAEDCQKDAGSAVAAGADSIIQTDGCSTSALIGVDPGLMPLADNGGPTPTHALMGGSPAIDAGDNADCGPGKAVETDQRGRLREDGACDIGSYEFEEVLAIARKDRVTGALLSGGDRWYEFNSTQSQRLSIQSNGFQGDTTLTLYSGEKPDTAALLAEDDDSGPGQFSNLRRTVGIGDYLIRVTGQTGVDPYFLRLMSEADILSFTDTAGPFAPSIRVMSAAGITGGCGPGIYCPTAPVTRAQMAIFLLKAIKGGNHFSPAATGNVFNDVGVNSFGADFIEQLAALGITSGCGAGNYCPGAPITREQVAVFLLRAWYGAAYMPPLATPAELAQFTDIADSFAKDWIVQLVDEGITGGCGDGKYCPTDPVTRGQMAAFIQRTFDLDVDL